MAIRTISSREVYRNKWTRFREDIIEYQDGRRGLYGVLDKDPAVIIIPLEKTPEGDFIWLVRQFRYTVGATFFELPQGGWEDAAADAAEMARGELAEETGLRSEKITLLSDLWVAYGAMRQVQHVFLAEGLSQGARDLEPEEAGMTVHRVLVSEFETMLLDGRVADNCTVAAWGIYSVWKARQPR